MKSCEYYDDQLHLVQEVLYQLPSFCDSWHTCLYFTARRQNCTSNIYLFIYLFYLNQTARSIKHKTADTHTIKQMWTYSTKTFQNNKER